MFLSLALIVGIILGFFFILKRLRPGGVYSGGFPVMKTLGSLSMGPKKAVALIEVCGQHFIIGIGSENITLISKLEISPDDAVFKGSSKGSDGRFQGFLERAGLSGTKQEK